MPQIRNITTTCDFCGAISDASCSNQAFQYDPPGWATLAGFASDKNDSWWDEYICPECLDGIRALKAVTKKAVAEIKKPKAVNVFPTWFAPTPAPALGTIFSVKSDVGSD
jgi:hypothetical protein